MKLTLTETAKRHDISKGYLSRCLRDGETAKGHDLRPYVVYAENGDVKHFEFPPDYHFPAWDGHKTDPSAEATSRADVPSPRKPTEVEAAMPIPVEATRPTEVEAAMPTPVEATPPMVVELYGRDCWLDMDEALDLMAEYLPIDVEKERSRTYSGLRSLLSRLGESFEPGGTAYSSKDVYVLEGKVLALVEVIQEKGPGKAEWTIKSDEWKAEVNAKLGLDKHEK